MKNSVKNEKNIIVVLVCLFIFIFVLPMPVYATGEIMAWGDNYNCQLCVPEPNTNFVAIAGGGYHSLGLKSDGKVVAWGCNGLYDLLACSAYFSHKKKGDSK